MTPYPPTAAHCRRLLKPLLWLAALFWLAAPRPAPAQTTVAAQPWSLETLVTRTPAEGEPVKTTIAVRAPAHVPVKHVVFYPSPNGKPFLTMTSGNTALDLIGPWVRASDTLNERGIAVVFADVPSDAQGRAIGLRAPAEVQHDLQAVVTHAQKTFAGAAVHLGLFGSATVPALNVASRLAWFSTANNCPKDLRHCGANRRVRSGEHTER